jgi:hypothetical protein
LVTGVRPDEAYYCGSVGGKIATKGDTDALTNGVSYAVGVAAVDSVGTLGPLRNCLRHAEIYDSAFYRRRRQGRRRAGQIS